MWVAGIRAAKLGSEREALGKGVDLSRELALSGLCKVGLDEPQHTQARTIHKDADTCLLKGQAKFGS